MFKKIGIGLLILLFLPAAVDGWVRLWYAYQYLGTIGP